MFLTILIILAIVFTLLHLFAVPTRVSWLGLGVLSLCVTHLLGSGLLS